MADTDSGGLLVQIGVTQARMERELATLVKQAGKSAGDMEKSFDAANNNIGKGARTAFGGVGSGANAAAPAVKNLSGYTANLASQLNDITVQLAGGQSPFQIMLQQGTQIGQVVTQAGGGFKTLGSIMAGAFMSVLNPVNLLTFAVIGLGGYAIQYFADLISGGDKANETLKEQEAIIRSVAERWGEAIEPLQEYVTALDRAKQVADIKAATAVVAADQWKVARDAVNEFNDEYAGYVSLLQTASANPDSGLHELGVAFENLQDKINAGTATTEDFDRVRTAATRAAATDGVGDLEEFIAGINRLGGALDAPLAKLGKLLALSGQAAMLDPSTWRGQSAPAPMFENNNIQYGEGGAFVTPENGPTPASRPSDLDTFKNRGGSAPKGGGRGANAYKDEVEGIKERTAVLRESTAAQAAINPLVNDYGFALEKAKAEQKLLADAQRAGMTITPALREQISELAGGYATASAEAKKLAESQGLVKKQAEEWASLEKDVFKGFLSDLKAGKSGAEALGSALNKIADKLLDMALDGIFSTKGGGGGGGGFFSSIINGIGKIFGIGYAGGTANTGGKRGQPAGIVHGEEAVIPLPAGGKVPVTISSPNTSQMSKAASHDTVTLNLQDDSGRMSEIADQRIHTASGTIVRVAVDQSYKTVKSNMAGLMTDTQARQL